MTKFLAPKRNILKNAAVVLDNRINFIRYII